MVTKEEEVDLIREPAKRVSAATSRVCVKVQLFLVQELTARFRTALLSTRVWSVQALIIQGRNAIKYFLESTQSAVYILQL